MFLCLICCEAMEPISIEYERFVFCIGHALQWSSICQAFVFDSVCSPRFRCFSWCVGLFLGIMVASFEDYVGMELMLGLPSYCDIALWERYMPACHTYLDVLDLMCLYGGVFCASRTTLIERMATRPTMRVELADAEHPWLFGEDADGWGI